MAEIVLISRRKTQRIDLIRNVELLSDAVEGQKELKTEKTVYEFTGKIEIIDIGINDDAIANEEQKMITGVLMRADYPIYRNDSELGEYYIQFSKETIKQMAQKLLLDNHQNWVNIEHISNSDVEGVNMVEMYLKDTEKGINPKGFEDISNGSLIATFKVNNPNIWNLIKEGSFLGFSIEGSFAFEKAIDEEESIYDEIMAMIDKITKIK